MNIQAQRHDGTPPGHDPGYEADSLRMGPIVGGLIVLVVVTVLFFALMWGLFNQYRLRETLGSAPTHPRAQLDAVPPEPRLQNDPRGDLVRMREGHAEILEGWAWVDREAGVARIPVDRAIDLIAGPADSGEEEKH